MARHADIDIFGIGNGARYLLKHGAGIDLIALTPNDQNGHPQIAEHAPPIPFMHVVEVDILEDMCLGSKLFAH